MTASSLDIVLPCYNPLPGWEDKIIQRFKELCNVLPEVQLRIIMVNDGSTRGITNSSAEKLKSAVHFFQFISNDVNRGKGYALREGVKNSNADIVIYTDVDFPYTTKSLLSIWDALRNGDADIAAGVLNQHYYKGVPLSRKVISRMLRMFNKLFLRTKISDTQRGLKGFNEKGKEIFLKTEIDRYLFDLEFIYLASRNKTVKIKPVEIELGENVHFTKMRAGILAGESINFLKILGKKLFNRS